MDNGSVTFEDYHGWTRSTALYPGAPGQASAITYTALGLSGELGEAAELLIRATISAGAISNQTKKIVRDDGAALTADRRAKIVDEIGDVFWYLSEMLSALRVEPSEVFEKNMEKLSGRLKTGTIKGDRREQPVAAPSSEDVDCLPSIFDAPLKEVAGVMSELTPQLAVEFTFFPQSGPFVGQEITRTFIGENYAACEAALRRAFGERTAVSSIKTLVNGGEEK